MRTSAVPSGRTHVSRQRWAPWAIAVLAVVGCSDGANDDVVPVEPEVGEQDREIVPGEGGPVD